MFASRTRAHWATSSAAEHDCCLEPVLEPDELPCADGTPAGARAVLRDGLAVGDASGSFERRWGREATLHPSAEAGRGSHRRHPAEAGLDDATIAAMKAEGAAR